MISGSKIQEIRKRKNISRAELSRRTGIPLRTIEDWEAGRRTLYKEDKIKLIADALNVNTRELYSDEYMHETAITNSALAADYDELEIMIINMVEDIYTRQGETGLLKLVDRFVYHTGVEKAVEIIKEYCEEGT